MDPSFVIFVVNSQALKVKPRNFQEITFPQKKIRPLKISHFVIPTVCTSMAFSPLQESWG